MTGDLQFGAQLWAQASDWAGFRDARGRGREGRLGRRLDVGPPPGHPGPWEQPIFEGWTALAGLAGVTSRIRLGLLVGANTFRNPGLTAKLATTLDHISDGRAVLGIGGAWFEREHDAFGIDFGAGFGERLDRLDESVAILRRLLDGERFSSRGHVLHAARRDLRAAAGPGPPADPHRWLRAEEDAAHRGAAGRRLEHLGDPRGGLEAPRHPRRALRRGRPRPRRDRADDQLPDHHSGDRGRGRAAGSPSCARTTGSPRSRTCPNLAGPPEAIAAELRPYIDLGFRHIMVRHARAVRPRDDRPPAGAPGGPGGRPGQGLTRCGSSRWPAASAERSSHPASRPPSATS